jgi:hypothetical protein
VAKATIVMIGASPDKRKPIGIAERTITHELPEFAKGWLQRRLLAWLNEATHASLFDGGLNSITIGLCDRHRFLQKNVFACFCGCNGE